MSTDRITSEAVDTQTKSPPLIRARASWHWTCTSCGRTQICRKSTTHQASCWGCGETYTVDVKERP